MKSRGTPHTPLSWCKLGQALSSLDQLSGWCGAPPTLLLLPLAFEYLPLTQVYIFFWWRLYHIFLYHNNPGLEDIPAPDWSQNVMSQRNNYLFRQQEPSEVLIPHVTSWAPIQCRNFCSPRVIFHHSVVGSGGKMHLLNDFLYCHLMSGKLS